MFVSVTVAGKFSRRPLRIWPRLVLLRGCSTAAFATLKIEPSFVAPIATLMQMRPFGRILCKYFSAYGGLGLTGPDEAREFFQLSKLLVFMRLLDCPF